MPKVNLSGMTIEALMELRERVGEKILKRRAELERQAGAVIVMVLVVIVVLASHQKT
jgi:hypothetical protein